MYVGSSARACGDLLHPVMAAGGHFWLLLIYLLAPSSSPAEDYANQKTWTKPPLAESSRGYERAPLSILFISSFFSGHIIPLLAVGEELVLRGHRVSFLTTEVSGSRLVPDVLKEIGLDFISAGQDPRTKDQYEEAIYGLMGKSLLEQVQEIATFARDHTLKLRVACDGLNFSRWNIIVADVFLSNLVRYLDLKWRLNIVLSTAVASDYASIDSPWPSPSTYCVGCTENLDFYGRLLNAVFFKNPLMSFWRMRSTKAYVAGNDSVMWNVVSNDPLFHHYLDEFHPSLVYSAVGVEYARPNYPGVHMVGPVIRSKNTPLDPNLLEWLSKNKRKDVVYISMGTTALVTEKMADSFITGILATNYSVVWSLRESNQVVLKGLDIDPERFYISNWVSQVEVLKHESVKVAITHCGTGGVHEALYFGVPLVCIPFWFDQFSWANRILDQGLGRVLYGDEVSPEKIAKALQEIEGKEFRERVLRVSYILKQAGGTRRAADLIEYYATVGYAHLVPSYIKYRWTWVEYYNTDVYCFLFVSSIVVVFVLRKLCCALIGNALSHCKRKID